MEKAPKRIIVETAGNREFVSPVFGVVFVFAGVSGGAGSASPPGATPTVFSFQTAYSVTSALPSRDVSAA